MSNTASPISSALAQSLVAAHQGGQRVGADLSTLESLSRAQALSIQHEVVSRLSVPIAGWKVAALPDGDLISAPIVTSRLLHSPARISQTTYGLGGVECEIAFRFAKEPVPDKGGFARAQIIEAIDGACAAIEIVDSRWTTAFSTPRNAMIADLLSNGALVVGAVNKNWRDVAFNNLRAHLGINGTTVCQSTGGHPNSDLIGLLTMFANDLRERGLVLRPGEIVTTGSYTGFHTARSGDEIAAEFDGFSPVSVAFQQL